MIEMIQRETQKGGKGIIPSRLPQVIVFDDTTPGVVC
jgi:hypothetical protein